MLLFADSFDYYSLILDTWDGVNAGAEAATPTSVGRFGTKGFPANAARYALKNLDGNYVTLTAGMAISISQSSPLFSFYDGGNPQVSFFADTGIVSAYRGFGSVLLGSTGSEYILGTYNYWEFTVVFDDTAGSIEIRKNDAVVLTLTGIDTAATANEYANRIVLADAAANNGHNVFYDDVYVIDDTDSGVAGVPNNAPLGDVRIECLFPDGNGNSSQWVGSDSNSVDNYLLVDENPYDDDTTYVQSATVSNKDTYTYENLDASTGTVYGVQPCFRAKKTDVGTRTIASVARVSGTEDDSADHALATGYQYFRDIREADPLGNAWSITNVNGAEFGPKVTS